MTCEFDNGGSGSGNYSGGKMTLLGVRRARRDRLASIT
jgi:hypothetical protein